MTDPTTFCPLKAVYVTLGCKLNFAETSTVAAELLRRGVTEAGKGETPDIAVVNTCSVTEQADRKCRAAIRRLARQWPEAAIIVTGCYAQLKPERVADLPGVIVVAGNDRKDRLTDYLDRWLAERRQAVEVTPGTEISRFTPSCSRGNRTRFFLKVQDGCDYWCSYCTIPKARGRSRSPHIADLIEQATHAAAEGGKEIVLTGVNIGDFGHRTGESFADLCHALDAVEGIERYRISSIEPNLLTDDLIRWIATESRAFMPHFHIPLQAGSDTVLRLMRRRYDTSLFRHKIELIRELMPDAFIGVDLIVGMRGETEALFEESRTFVESLPISRLHVFTYSERPSTRALDIDYRVAPDEQHRRTRVMIDLSDEKLRTFSARFFDTQRLVLIEHLDKDSLGVGHTDNYLPVEIAGVTESMINTSRLIEITGFATDPRGECRLSGRLCP